MENKLSPGEVAIFKIIFKSTVIIMGLAVLPGILSFYGPTMTDANKYITAVTIGYGLNIFLHQNIMRFMNFRHVESAIEQDKIRETEAIPAIQHMAHFMMLYPISAGLVLLMLLSNIYISLSCLVAIWLLVIVGQASKYRLNLYLNAIQKIDSEK